MAALGIGLPAGATPEGGWQRIIGKAKIAATISGTWVKPEGRPQQPLPPLPPFSEKFEQDGTWVRLIQARTTIRIDGHWAVESNEICVTPANGQRFCRRIFREIGSGKLGISGWPGLSKDVIVVVEPIVF